MARPNQSGGPVSPAEAEQIWAEQDDADKHARNEALIRKAQSGEPLSAAELDLVVQFGASDTAGNIIAYLPIEQQNDLIRRMGSSGSRTRRDLESYIQGARQEAFRDWIAGGQQGPLPPGVDKSGGGTGLSPDAIQGLLVSGAQTEAEGIQAAQPGMEAYQEDAVLDNGPGYSFLGRLRDEGAFYDETVDGMNVTEEGPAFQQERTDTTGRAAQERSLAEYDNVISQEGLTAVDRARIEEMRQDTARRARAQEGAIMADAAERGRASGNASLLLRNQAQQSATNTRALGDMQTAALGLERKDMAIRNRGFLGGDIQAADDAIDKFNTSQRQDVLQRDVDRKNRAEADRWGLEQDNKNENVDVVQGAIGVEYDSDTARSDKNADRQYEANVANDRGTQAHYGDQWTAFGNKFGVTQAGPAFDEGDKSTPGAPGDNGLTGAGQGAIGGAAVGSKILPGYGTMVGAGAGAAAGFLGSRTKRVRASNGSW